MCSSRSFSCAHLFMEWPILYKQVLQVKNPNNSVGVAVMWTERQVVADILKSIDYCAIGNLYSSAGISAMVRNVFANPNIRHIILWGADLSRSGQALLSFMENGIDEHHFIIGDEINRAPPKTQSAMIEGMQENQVTIGKEKYSLPEPFFVMATENPIENAGVYPLPEAQIDRFLFKFIMDYPEEEDERNIMETNITLRRFEDFNLKPVVTPKRILEMQKNVKAVYLDDSIKSYILSIVRKTREKIFKDEKNIAYGSSPRASIGLFIASKARALMKGRDYVLPEDVKDVVFSVMRHRIILSYKAVIQKISPDAIIQEILDSVNVE